MLTLSLNPEVRLSGLVSTLISSNSSSLGDIHVIGESHFISDSSLHRGILGDGSGVGVGVGSGVGRGVGNSLIGDKHLLMPLGTSSNIDGGCKRLLPDDDALCALNGSKT